MVQSRGTSFVPVPSVVSNRLISNGEANLFVCLLYCAFGIFFILYLVIVHLICCHGKTIKARYAILWGWVIVIGLTTGMCISLVFFGQHEWHMTQAMTLDVTSGVTPEFCSGVTIQSPDMQFNAYFEHRSPLEYNISNAKHSCIYVEPGSFCDLAYSCVVCDEIVMVKIGSVYNAYGHGTLTTECQHRLWMYLIIFGLIPILLGALGTFIIYHIFRESENTLFSELDKDYHTLSDQQTIWSKNEDTSGDEEKLVSTTM